MSHQVQIDYQGIAIQCQSICEVAETRIKELDEMLTKLKKSSSTLMKGQAVELAKTIESEKQNLLSQVNVLKAQAVATGKRGIVTVDSDMGAYKHRGDIIASANNLQRTIDEISSKRIIEFESLLMTLLGESINESYRKMRERNNGVVSIDDATQEALDSIEDAMLKQFTYLAYLEDNTLDGERLIFAGKALMEKVVNSTYESRYAEEEAKIRAELEASKVDRGTVEKVISEVNGSAREKLTSLRETATQEIVGEKVRQKSLKIIVDAIKQRGFVVDKKNIKIKRDTNEVIMVALKASGEKAEFKIFLDGRFIYDFRGYEGQACQKDIEPFMHDLEEVYGIHVTKQTEIWSNPDKISTMKYQAINTNKNKK